MNIIKQFFINHKKETIIVLSLIIALAVGITVWAVFFREPDEPLNPDYPPIDTDDNQTPIEGDETGSKLENPAGGGAVEMTYQTEVKIDLSDGTATLYFANPSKSNQDVVLQIVIQGEVIVQSDRITPGNKVTNLPLADGAADKLQVGGYDGKFTVLCYNADGERGMVSPEASVTITVTE